MLGEVFDNFSGDFVPEDFLVMARGCVVGVVTTGA